MVGILFYWTWRGVDLLPTYPFKGSKFHVVLFQNIFVGWFNFSFENSFEERMRGLEGMGFEKIEVIPIYLQKWLKLKIRIHFDFAQENKEKMVEF